MFTIDTTASKRVNIPFATLILFKEFIELLVCNMNIIFNYP